MSADLGTARANCRDARACHPVLVADRTAVDAAVEEIRPGRPAVAGDIGAERGGPLTAPACHACEGGHPVIAAGSVNTGSSAGACHRAGHFGPDPLADDDNGERPQ